MKEKYIIYQLLLRAYGDRECTPSGSFLQNGSGKFNDIDGEELKRIKSLSVSAIWFTGIIAHASGTRYKGIQECNPSIVKGIAGSPYSIRDYYDVDPDLAVSVPDRMAEFEAMVGRSHNAGVDVIIDFVPNHISREYHSKTDNFTPANLYQLNGPLKLPDSLKSDYVEDPAFATGNDQFTLTPTCNDWYDTVKLNYDNHSTWEKMYNILEFWAAKGVDGFRCDMVEMVRPDFFKWAFARLRKKYRDILFIAEVYQKQNYRIYANAGFDLLYDKSGFYDALKDIYFHKRPAVSLTAEWQSIGDLQPKMLNFLENHDEQRIASDFYLGNGEKGSAALAVSLFFNTAPFMLYFGQEYGERGMENEGFSSIDGRTSIYDYCIVPSIKRAISHTLDEDEKRLCREYRIALKKATADSIFHFGKTFDLMYANPLSDFFNPVNQFAFLRGYDRHLVLVIANFDSREVAVKVNVPDEAYSFFGIERCPDFDRKITVKAFDYRLIYGSEVRRERKK